MKKSMMKMMKNSMKNSIRKTNWLGLFLFAFLLLVPVRAWSVGWTPTDGGLVVDLKQGEHFLLSVMIDGQEYFVCDYPSYNSPTDPFKYATGDYLKLIKQDDPSVYSKASVWTVDTALNRIDGKTNYALGGIAYTMRSSIGHTLKTSEANGDKNDYKIMGVLTNPNTDKNYLCDVIFVCPTDHDGIVSFDPENNLGRNADTGTDATGQKKKGRFNGEKGFGYAGMPYREVYWLAIPKANSPKSYTNAALITFNQTTSTVKWYKNGSIAVSPGRNAYAYADNTSAKPHHLTPRTIFRLYLLERPLDNCPNSYFFATDQQDEKSYRKENPPTTSYTTPKQTYTIDWMYCMDSVPGTSIYQTDLMHFPKEDDNTYFYVGKKNLYVVDANKATLKLNDAGTAVSEFTQINELRVKALAGASKTFTPAKESYGRMVVDTTATAANLGVTFEPAGYFLRTSNDKNVRMRLSDDGTYWTCDEMWYINEDYIDLSIKATTFTGAEFSATDKGADIEGWSEMVAGKDVPVLNHEGWTAEGRYGWARIYPGNESKNGGMVFVLAKTDRHIEYNYNGMIGTAIPDQYPAEDATVTDGKVTLKVQDARLKAGFRFDGWATSPEGVVVYHPGNDIEIPEGTTTLYAKGEFLDTYRVAFSFIHPTNKKRYFLTHPGTAPRYARARTYTDWTNVYQGMSDVENSEPNYLSTYKMIGNPTCALCSGTEYVLDPRHETVKGVEDSLTFYEYWEPADDEFLGLYYTEPNTILANNTWAGAFQSTEGWPTYNRTAVDSTKLFSARYFDGMKTGTYAVHDRPRTDYVQYKTGTNQFDGVATEEEGTTFQITGIAVEDAHYVILPDTTDPSTPWTNAITFDYHEESSMQKVWSKLIGKQLLACLRVGPDTVYFHPKDNKTMTNANDLRLSLDYRLTHYFQFIHDSRIAEGLIAEGDSAYMEETEDGFCCNVHSGASSPIGPTVDIVDTLRVWLHPTGTSKIKDYYGRWKKKRADDGLTVLADGSRYRDILVTTKTYHYGPTQTRLILKPEEETYNFSPLAGQPQTLTFTLEKQTYHELLDAKGVVVRTDILATKDTTEILDLRSATCTLKSDSYFTIGTRTATDITLTTKALSNDNAKYDTLTVTVTIDDTAVPVAVPLMQTYFSGTELIWSVYDEGTKKRHFITAGTGGLIDRKFTQKSQTLYHETNGKTLIKGSKNAANDDAQYITPWTYSSGNPITLKTEDPVDKYFAINEGTPGVNDEEHATQLHYEFVRINTNDNGNFEEQVKLHYGDGTGESWLKFSDGALSLTTVDKASVFSWGYLLDEYNLMDNGTYPSATEVVFGYNNTAPKQVKTAFKAYHEYSMLLDNKKVYVCRKDEADLADLIDADQEWKTTYAVNYIADARTFDGDDPVSSGLSKTPSGSTFTSTITPAGDSPMEVKIDGKYVNIVDTLQVTVGLQGLAPTYRFKGNWSSFTSVSDANVKIPLIRKTYHTAPYDSLVCAVNKDENNYSFPNTLREGVRADSLHTFHLNTYRHRGTNTFDVEGNVASHIATSNDTLTESMHLDNIALAEIRLVDDYGKIPEWCEIADTTANTVTVRCKSNGIRSPRSAHLYFAYIIMVPNDDPSKPDVMRFVNFHLTVSQSSLFQYANNQTLIHSTGASGDPLMSDGRQQTHENRRILYYYNPEPYNEPDQSVELPVRERGFYGWWRWYREGGDGIDDTDIPDSVWSDRPKNTYGSYNYPFRIIGDSVDDGAGGKKLVTMGRYTVFHYPASDYKNKKDPPSNSPKVNPPYNKDTVIYVVDLSAYIDHLPLSMKYVNQVDTAALDTMKNIIEPTLSLREAFELHPWTEMAEKLENYKDTIGREGSAYRNMKYMEDHEVMAPIGNRLLLRTEQRYNYKNLSAKGHSESLLGYYMRDDHWSDGEWSDARKDTMIWCGGWDADCDWYFFNPADSTYSACDYPITEDDDFLNVPAKGSITAGKEADTVVFCLRARSQSTTGAPGTDEEETVDGAYWFNICRYTVIYHDYNKFGPLKETTKNGITKALVTNDEIEQNYEVLERLNFDYLKPGPDYHVYSHPLPWADGSYGYSYPVRPDIPDNRHHNDFAPNFAGVGEYGIINKIPYTKFWNTMEQHGGAENGYMVYCDGMNSAGQVAALSLETKLCEGQKMYFSGYVGNPSNQTGSEKARPNFTITVQGSSDGENWKDITSYMTGDIEPAKQWYQIFFPINQQKEYDKFRVRIYNMASSFDGNDFTIDDLCIFATKPPLIAYQANTRCVEEGQNDSLTHVVLRVDYQGFVDTFTYNLRDVYYTVHQNDTTFVDMLDGYLNPKKKLGDGETKPDTVYGHITMPRYNYVPVDEDSVFTNLTDFVTRFDTTFEKYRKEELDTFFNKGYMYENLDGVVRPVLYVIHQAKMTADNTYKVRLATGEEGLMNSKCAMTSNLKVTNRMVLMLDDEEKEDGNVTEMCANSTYDLSVRVKGSMFLDSIAPMDVNGSCVNDWLLYGDTSDVTSVVRYGYKYSDIKKVIKDILRREGTKAQSNKNQFARSFAEINRNELIKNSAGVTLSDGVVPYDLLDSLVSKGFLTLYKSKLTATVNKDDSLQYVIFPIVGTGSETVNKNNMEVCPTPIVIKLKPRKGGAVPLIVGGIHRDSTQLSSPVVVLVNKRTADEQVALRIDSIMSTVALHSITLLSTDDPNFYEGVHILKLEPDKVYNFGGDNLGYYTKGDDILLRPAAANTYEMKQGYSYTFGILLQSLTGSLDGADGCPVGTVPFTLSIVPDYLRWDPKSKENNQWNNPENWIGVDADNNVLHENARFAPLAATDIIIPQLPDSLPYPNLPDPSTIASKDSVKQVGFVYNQCDDIRFLAGSAITQQQRLTCDVVVVDMTMPHNKWALRSAPITGMISGDLFMADADLSGETKMWSVGEFDAAGRTNTTGNAAFYPAVYSNTVIRYGNGADVKNDTLTNEGWSKVTNALTLSLPPAQGWAVYTRTKSGKAAEVRLPKSDDRFYFYYANGDRAEDSYEDNLRTLRTTNATSAGADAAGKLAYRESDQTFTLTKASDANTTFVFGNPSMGYIDIWGFIADNSLEEEIRYIDKDGIWRTVTSETTGTDTITNLARYLPPMHAIVIKVSEAAGSKNVTLKSNRIVTHPRQKVRAGAPRHISASGRSKGIMTVTATNAASSRCTTRLLLGQGYSDEIRKGEDAILTTVNIDKYSNTSYPATPFNIYAVEEGYGLSIDLLDEILNVPVSFYMSKLSFNPVTKLWFTGVNSIDGQLVLYDAQTDTERLIIDGTCLEIETPTNSHEVRYYIRRHGYRPGTTTDPIATQFESLDSSEEQAMKYIQNGVVYILRNGHIYTLLGQKIQ